MARVTAAEVFEKTFGEPSPKQLLFHKADSRYVAYGGAKGGGKSHAVRQKATYLCFAHPGIKILIVRRTLAELDKNHVAPLNEAYSKFPSNLRPKYTEQKKMFAFPWGSTITLGFCDNENDVWQFQGQEYDVVFIDEATRLSYFQFYHLNSTVRGVNTFPKRTYLTCNPGGQGHYWMKRLFIDKEYHADENPEDFTFIPALVFDNLAMFQADPLYHRALKQYMTENKLKEETGEAVMYAMMRSEYVKTLKMGSEDEIKAYLYGDWNVFSGLYFGEFDTKTHCFDPMLIPAHWRRTVSMDYGLDMFAVLWFAVDERGFAYCYREYLQKDLPISAAAVELLKANGNDVIHEYIAPPDLWNRRQDTGKSAADIFGEWGIPLIKAGNDRVSGWLNTKEWLKIRDWPTPTGIQKRPVLMISKECKALIDNIQSLTYDERKKDDVSTEPHDKTHAPDALRYWCSRRQLSTYIAPAPEHYEFAIERPGQDGFFADSEVTEDYLTGGYAS